MNDADEILVRDDGRTEYTGVWENRALRVVVYDDGATVVTVIDVTRRAR